MLPPSKKKYAVETDSLPESSSKPNCQGHLGLCHCPRATPWFHLMHPHLPASPHPSAGYLNVLVNSQWKSRWCSVRGSHLHFYQDRNRSKVAQQPLSLVGCEVVPDPSPDHLYSFRIVHNGEELAKLEVSLTCRQAAEAGGSQLIALTLKEPNPAEGNPVQLHVKLLLSPVIVFSNCPFLF